MADFDYNDFTENERERHLRMARGEAVERHRENDFYGSPSFYKPRGFFHGVRFALMVVPFWVLLIWLAAFSVGIPTGSMPKLREFGAQWIYWVLMVFLGLSSIIVFIYSYVFKRKSKLKLVQMIIGLLGSAIVSPFVAAVIAFFISKS